MTEAQVDILVWCAYVVTLVLSVVIFSDQAKRRATARARGHVEALLRTYRLVQETGQLTDKQMLDGTITNLERMRDEL